MSLVFILLWAIKQTKDLTSNRACDFQTKSVGNNGIGLVWLDKTKKNDLTINKPEEDKEQALTSGTDGVKCKQERDDTNLS